VDNVESAVDNGDDNVDNVDGKVDYVDNIDIADGTDGVSRGVLHHDTMECDGAVCRITKAGARDSEPNREVASHGDA